MRSAGAHGPQPVSSDGVHPGTIQRMGRMAVSVAAFAVALAIGWTPGVGSQTFQRSAATGILAYSVPTHAESADFSVQARVPGKAWQPIKAVAVTVDLHSRSRATLASFDASAPVEV